MPEIHFTLRYLYTYLYAKCRILHGKNKKSRRGIHAARF